GARLPPLRRPGGQSGRAAGAARRARRRDRPALHARRARTSAVRRARPSGQADRERGGGRARRQPAALPAADRRRGRRGGGVLRRRVTPPQPQRPEWAFAPEGWARETRGWDTPAIEAAYRRRWPEFLAAVRGTGTLGVAHEVPESQ